MSNLLNAPTAAWDAQVARAAALVEDDLTADPSYSDRYWHARDQTRDQSYMSQSSKFTAAQRLFTRAFNPVMFVLSAAVYIATLTLVEPGGWLSIVLVLAIVSAVPAVWFALANATYDRRAALWLPMDTRERYRRYMRDTSRKTIADLGSDQARQVLTDLDSMTEATEELIRERDALERALASDRLSPFGLLDTDDARRRLGTVDATLTEVTAVHIAAAAILAKSTGPAVETTAPQRTPQRVATVLDGQHQADLQAAIGRIANTLNA